MATHDVTKTVEQILALGGAEAEIRRSWRVRNMAGKWEALNGSAEYGLKALLAQYEARAVPQADRTVTAAQRKYIEDLGGSAPEGLSRPAASDMIEALKARRAGARVGVSGEIWD